VHTPLCADAFNFLACLWVSPHVKWAPQTLVTALTKKLHDLSTAILSLLCAAFVALSLGGCAEGYYVDTNRTPEAPYNTYYAPDYYPYYPWYSYYGDAYYSGD